MLSRTGEQLYCVDRYHEEEGDGRPILEVMSDPGMWARGSEPLGSFEVVLKGRADCLERSRPATTDEVFLQAMNMFERIDIFANG
jgi:hypothetical protein